MIRRPLKLAGSLVSVLALTGLAACGGTSTNDDAKTGGTIDIGAIYPLSGPITMQGTATLEGARYAVKEINANGGIKALNGAKLRLVERDAGGSPESATAAATELIQKGEIAALMGAWLGTYSTAIAPLAERAKLPFVTEAFGDDLTENNYEFVNDISPRSSSLAELELQGLEESAKKVGFELKTVVVGGDNGFSTVPLRKGILDGLKSRNIDVLADNDWTSPLRDASPFVATVKKKDPDAVIVLGYAYGDIESVVAGLRGAGYTKPIITNGGQSVLPAWLDSGTIADGLITEIAYGPIATAEAVASGIAKQAGAPWANQEHFLGYTDVYVVKEALEAAGSTDSAKLGPAMRAINVTSGPLANANPSGKFSFDKTGRVDGNFSILQQWQKSADGSLKPCVIWPENAKTCEPQLG